MHGRVRVDGPAGSVVLGPGERARSDALPLAQPPAAALSVHQVPRGAGDSSAAPQSPASHEVATAEARGPSPTVSECATIDQVDLQRECLLRYSAEDGLAGQTALYSLARLERRAGRLSDAAAYGAMYGRRFPDGMFAPEASAQLVGDCASLGRLDEGVEAAGAFLRKYASNPSAPRIRLLRAEMLCRLGRTDEALGEYERGRPGSPPDSCEWLASQEQCLALAGRVSAAEAMRRAHLGTCPRTGQLDQRPQTPPE